VSHAVLDASVFVAAISPSEIHHVTAHGKYDSWPEDRAFLVPSLLRGDAPVVICIAHAADRDASIAVCGAKR
jgi:hypothetical protein